MRVYIPATTSLLQRLVDTSEFGSGPSAPGSGASAGLGAAGASVEGSGAAGPGAGGRGGPGSGAAVLGPAVPSPAGSGAAGSGAAGPGAGGGGGPRSGAAGPGAAVAAAAAGVPGAAAVELTAFAVTPGLREWYVDDDLEELEYAASREAARASLRLLAADPAAAPRRVVVAAEVPDTAVTVRDDLDRGVVRLAGPVPLGQIAAAHVDDSDAEAAVRAASAVIDAADLGDADAEATVDDAEGFELAWYTTQELGAFLELLGPRL